MIAPFPATSSRAARSGSPEPSPSESTVGSSPSRAGDRAARLVQIGLALYLIPVLILIFMIGGVGIAVAGFVAMAVRLASWGGRSRGRGEEKDVVES